jgi:hypothetical protein
MEGSGNLAQFDNAEGITVRADGTLFFRYREQPHSQDPQRRHNVDVRGRRHQQARRLRLSLLSGYLFVVDQKNDARPRLGRQRPT